MFTEMAEMKACTSFSLAYYCVPIEFIVCTESVCECIHILFSQFHMGSWVQLAISSLINFISNMVSNPRLLYIHL